MKRGGFRRGGGDNRTGDLFGSGVRETSVEAYRYIRARGITGAQCEHIVGYLFEHPPRTRAEISRGTGIAINAVCGRVRELMDGGALNENAPRPCSTSGRMAHPVTLAR